MLVRKFFYEVNVGDNFVFSLNNFTGVFCKLDDKSGKLVSTDDTNIRRELGVNSTLIREFSESQYVNVERKSSGNYAKSKPVKAEKEIKYTPVSIPAFSISDGESDSPMYIVSPFGHMPTDKFGFLNSITAYAFKNLQFAKVAEALSDVALKSEQVEYLRLARKLTFSVTLDCIQQATRVGHFFLRDDDGNIIRNLKVVPGVVRNFPHAPTTLTFVPSYVAKENSSAILSGL